MEEEEEEGEEEGYCKLLDCYCIITASVLDCICAYTIKHK
jgi:hypothetical protein